nr:MAG TPA: hypothetical protein [Bacteriophage sp.]
MMSGQLFFCCTFEKKGRGEYLRINFETRVPFSCPLPELNRRRAFAPLSERRVFTEPHP